MTREEAVTKLTNVMNDDIYSWSPSILTAFNMAVDALRGAETERTKTRDGQIKCVLEGRTERR